MSHQIDAPRLIEKLIPSNPGDAVKARVICGMAVVLFFATLSSHAQISCPTTQQRQPLVCLLPDSISSYSFAGNAAQQGALAIAVPINGAIGVQLTQLPTPSGTSGTITLEEKGNPLGRPFDNAGPILVDVPGAVGRRHLYSSFSYQRFNFNAIDGLSLGSGNLKFGYGGVLNPAQQTVLYGSNQDVVKLHLDQYVASFTYGASKTTDISVIIPFNSVSATSTASNITAFSCPYSGGPCVETQDPNSPNAVKPNPVSGSASGIGDLTFTVKQLVYGGEGQSWAVALGGGLRLPTGDPYNYLGSGAYGANVFGLISYRSLTSRFSPHFKLGEQWNGPSPLVNPNSSGQVNLPGGLQYAVGTDVRLPKGVTLSVDVLGSQFVNSPSLAASDISLPASFTLPANTSAASALKGVAQFINNTYTTVNLSSGLKYKPYPGLIFYANVFLALKNLGLRSDPVPLVGVSYNWGKRK